MRSKKILPQPFLQLTQDDRRNNPANPAPINREDLDACQLGTLLGIIFSGEILAD
jgi:hypothetical protein